MSKAILVIGAILMLWSSDATAQGRLAVGHCLADLRTLCPGVLPGNDRLRACMRDRIHDVSDECLLTLAKFAEVRRRHPVQRASSAAVCERRAWRRPFRGLSEVRRRRPERYL